jgi:hypothetical protein
MKPEEYIEKNVEILRKIKPLEEEKERLEKEAEETYEKRKKEVEEKISDIISKMEIPEEVLSSYYEKEKEDIAWKKLVSAVEKGLLTKKEIDSIWIWWHVGGKLKERIEETLKRRPELSLPFGPPTPPKVREIEKKISEYYKELDRYNKELLRELSEIARKKFEEEVLGKKS